MPIGEEYGEFADFVASLQAIASLETAEDVVTYDMIMSVFGELSERDQSIICRRFELVERGICASEAIDDKSDITRERMRQIESKVLARLRRPFRKAIPKDMFLD